MSKDPRTGLPTLFSLSPTGHRPPHKRLRRGRAAPFALALVLTASLSGCGYTVGFRAPEGVTSVAVPVFDNRTSPAGGGSRRELELELTRAVVREVQRRTPLRLVDEDRADVIIRGALTRVRESVAVEGPDDEPLRSSARFEARVVVVRADGTLLREATLVEVAEYLPGPGRLGTAPEALEAPAAEAFERLAERIVMLLEG